MEPIIDVDWIHDGRLITLKMRAQRDQEDGYSFLLLGAVSATGGSLRGLLETAEKRSAEWTDAAIEEFNRVSGLSA